MIYRYKVNKKECFIGTLLEEKKGFLTKIGLNFTQKVLKRATNDVFIACFLNSSLPYLLRGLLSAFRGFHFDTKTVIPFRGIEEDKVCNTSCRSLAFHYRCFNSPPRSAIRHCDEIKSELRILQAKPLNAVLLNNTLDMPHYSRSPALKGQIIIFLLWRLH